jgi:hypothetical protein
MSVFLFSVTEGNGPIEYREYFAEADRVRWDGRSSLRADLATVTRAALTEARRRVGDAVRLERLELQTAGEPGSAGYYFFTADFQPSDTGEVLIDLSGAVVLPVVHLFGDYETYQRYAFHGGHWAPA